MLLDSAVLEVFRNTQPLSELSDVSKMQETHGTSRGIHNDPSTSGVLPDTGIVVEIAL